MSRPDLTKEQLARVDVLVRELAQIVGAVILDLCPRTTCCIVAADVAEQDDQDDPNGGRIPAHVEYQVSDGLPGRRASSVDEGTYEAALDALPGVIESTKAACARNGVPLGGSAR